MKLTRIIIMSVVSLSVLLFIQTETIRASIHTELQCLKSSSVSNDFHVQGEKVLKLSQLEGIYPLTPDVAIEIKGNQLGMGQDTSHVIEYQSEGNWVVPDYDMEISGQKTSQGTVLKLERFGETVVLSKQLPDVFEHFMDIPLEELASEVAPRLMIGNHVPGVSIALIREGEIVTDLQFGLKNSEDPGSQVEASSVFEACSMSKPTFAYFVLKLVEQGRLDLDTPLVEYLEQDYTEDPQHRKITARMVLTHSSGFPNWRPGGRRNGGAIPVHFEPGTQQRYSGEGIWFLQKAVEKVLEVENEAEAMDAILHRTVLEPIGMPNSHYIWQEHYQEEYADGHNREGQLKRSERRPYQQVNTAFTLYTTPVEYAAFLIELMKQDRTASHSLGENLLQQMTTPQSGVIDDKLLPRRREPDDGARYFGFGLRIEKLNTGLRVGHTGSNSSGHKCVSEYNPDSGNGLVIMTNSDNGNKVYQGLMRYLAE